MVHPGERGMFCVVAASLTESAEVRLLVAPLDHGERYRSQDQLHTLPDIAIEDPGKLSCRLACVIEILQSDYYLRCPWSSPLFFTEKQSIHERIETEVL